AAAIAGGDDDAVARCGAFLIGQGGKVGVDLGERADDGEGVGPGAGDARPGGREQAVKVAENDGDRLARTYRIAVADADPGDGGGLVLLNGGARGGGD